MNLRKIFFRGEQQTSVNVAICWEVRWKSRYGAFGHQTKPEVRVFPSKSEAVEFERALRDAFKLIKHTSGNYIELKKQCG